MTPVPVGQAPDGQVPDGQVPDGQAREGRRALAVEVTARLTQGVEVVLGDRCRTVPGERPNYFDDGVVVDAFSLSERCPRRLANPPADYVDSVATARRRVGLLVVRRLAVSEDRSELVDAVDAVMADSDQWPIGLRQWVLDLEPAARRAVAAAATTWAASTLRLVGRRARVTWADPARTPSWNLPGRLVQLRGGADATLGTLRTGERLLVLSDAVPGPRDRLRAGFIALVRAVASGHAPSRVALGSQAAGSIEPFPVDERLLELTADRVLEVIGYRSAPDDAPPAPGVWCDHCHLLDQCNEGSAFVASR